MIKNQQSKIIVILSFFLVIFTFVASYFGVFVSDTYSRETLNWAAQAIGQDAVNLFLIVPLLIILSILVYRKNRIAVLLWSGVMVYLVYSYAIYGFATHFNNLFLIYCLVFGFSFYAFMYFLYTHINEPIAEWFSDKVPVKIVGVYLIIIASLFYFLWLSAIVPAILTDTIPQDIVDAGLLTNPVYVLDLSIVLPGFILTAILLLKRRSLGLLLAPVTLVLSILMPVAIAGTILVMNIRGVASSLAVIPLMGLLALISAIMLTMYLRSIKRNARIAQNGGIIEHG